MTIITTEKVAKNRKKFSCETCHYITVNYYDYKKHLTTDKHLRQSNTIEKTQEIAKSYMCYCGKEYKYNASLFNHKKKCHQDNIDIEKLNNTQDDSNSDSDGEFNYKKMFLEMVKQNKELQKTIIDQNKLIQSTITEIIPKIGNTTTTTNSNNNINIVMNNINFLNEKCKDALKLKDFVDSIDVNVEDLEFTGKKGIVEGLSKLFLENYSKLPPHLRPLWCGDKKRQNLYIKEDEWLEDKNSQKTIEAIKDLSFKQAKNTNKYSKKHPNWMADDKMKDTYMGIISQTTSDVDSKMKKILSSISQNTHLTNDIKEGIHSITE